MEALETAVPTPGSYPLKSATAAVVCVLAGFGAFVAFAVVDHRVGPIGFRGLGVVYCIGLWASVASMYLATPVLGIVAIVGVLRNEEQAERCRTDAVDSGSVRRASNRLLLAAVLLVLVALLPVVLRVARGGLEVWFIGLALLGVQMGRVSRRLARTAGLGWSRGGKVLMGTVALLLVGAALGATGVSRYVVQRGTDSARTRTYEGDSEGLEQTVIVPTLDSPLPPRQNVIWCSSFQLAWNEIRDNVVGALLEVPEAAELAARLNNARQSLSDLDPKSVYAAADWVEKGIRERIRRDMAAQFPSHTLPDFNDFNGGILAYSYLTAHVPFKYPFRQVDEGLTFTDSQGVQTRVVGFGLWQAFLHRYKNPREQVEVLYTRSKDRDHSWELTEYALDLCRHSEPYQVVVARVEPEGSLAETLEHVRTAIAEFRVNPHYEDERLFAENDELTVPEMFWRIDHRFKELIGKVVANVGMPIVEAFQTIEFRLDRSGAILESEAMVAIAALPRHFDFNRPFLVYLQKRGAEHPFFVMWVDNAELLVRK